VLAQVGKPQRDRLAVVLVAYSSHPLFMNRE
jgi:hypothetical protein